MASATRNDFSRGKMGKNILDQAHNVRSEMEMYTLVANLANGDM